MKIELANNIGFCGGVAAAVRKAEQAAKKYGQLQMLGDIVHNEIVVKRLSNAGVKVVKKLDEVDKTKPLLLRAHGTDQKLEEQLRKEKYFLIDATCPLVKEIHQEAEVLESEGRKVIIIGDHGHDEVLGIQSRLEEPLIVSSVTEAEKLPVIKKVGIVVQSTQFLHTVGNIVAVIAQKCDDLHYVNTICRPTRLRQEQVKELAARNELMLIVGSTTSANTKRLVEIAKTINANTVRIASKEELEQKWFETVASVGISGGASTPEDLIESIKKSVQKISESLLN